MVNISTDDNSITQGQKASNIKDLIITVRGVQVLLDCDVAMLYGYEKRALNQTAKRNEERFPERYRFQLTREEYEQLPLKSQYVILKKGRGQHVKKFPYAYTEHGISMLAGLLRNKTAVQVSINIIDAFIEMKKFVNVNRDVFAKIVSIDNKLLEHDRKFDEVFDLLQLPEVIKQNIFYKGQFYDAFTLVADLIEKATTSIIVIDNYADNSVLEMLAGKKSGVSITIITANPGKISIQLLNKFIAQYGPVKVVASKDFHDRFVILDEKDVYAFGASLKDLGNKCFEVSKVEDTARFLSYVQGLI